MQKVVVTLLLVLTVLVGGTIVYSYIPSVVAVAEAGGTGGSSG